MNWKYFSLFIRAHFKKQHICSECGSPQVLNETATAYTLLEHWYCQDCLYGTIDRMSKESYVKRAY